jgi:hypothetical protein
MLTPLRTGTRLAALMLCSLLLSLLFAACGGSSPTSSTPTPTPTPTAKPWPTATPTAMTTPTSTTANWQTYSGADFSISYPTGWTESSSGNQIVGFIDSTGNIGASIGIVPNLSDPLTGEAVAAAAQQYMQQQFKNTQDDGVDQNVQFAGENWSQKEFDGDPVTGGSTRFTVLILTTLHQPSGGSTKPYFMLFLAPKTEFQADLDDYFNPMAGTFEFK